MSELAELMAGTLGKAVTFRTHGDRGQFRKPMMHRWPIAKVRGSVPLAMALAENITRGRPLLDRLMRRGLP